MTLKEQCDILFSNGLTVACLAKKMGRDSSTLYKWLNGTRELSPTVEQEAREQLKEIQKIWLNCNFNKE